MKKENVKIISTVSAAVCTFVTIGIGAAVGGAIGMSYAIYGAIMGGVIGAIIGYSLDHSLEVVGLGGAIGAEIGAVVGIIMERIYKKEYEESGIDNSDYVKGLGCALKTAMNHASDATDCSNLGFRGCVETMQGFNEIAACMGKSNHYNIFDGIEAA